MRIIGTLMIIAGSAVLSLIFPWWIGLLTFGCAMSYCIGYQHGAKL